MESEAVTLSPKFQLVVPAKERKEGGYTPGQKFVVFQSRGQLTYVPVRGIKELRGSLGKMRLNDVRDHNDRFP